MAAGTEPKVYSIPAGASFLDALAAGLLERYGADPLGFSRATILLPTRRACRALAESFLRLSDGSALLLPTIRPLGDIDEEELDLRLEAGAGGALPMPPLERSFLLARLLKPSALADGHTAHAFRLAESLGALLDGAITEGIGLDNLPAIVPETLAEHWQATLRLLAVIRENWPAIKAERGQRDAAEQARQGMLDWVSLWKAEPPQDPVIVAGSTGSIPATADLLHCIARLPQGAVVLPGLDAALDADSWAALHDEPTHPQHGLARLLNRLGIPREEVKPWPAAIKAEAGARAALLGAALLPQGETHRWRDREAVPDAAFAGLKRIVANHPREEAQIIALLLRETLEQPGRRAALITPDRALARRVAAELARFGIEIDDSAGRPLAETPPAVFLRLLLGAQAEGGAALPLLALLKHPFAQLGQPRGAWLHWVRRVEISHLRGAHEEDTLEALGRRIAADERSASELLPVFAKLSQALAPLRELMRRDEASPEELLRALIGAAEALSQPEGVEAGPLWRREAGEALHGLMLELLAASPALGPVEITAWPALFDALLAGRVVRPRRGGHPRLAILGLLEARLLGFDRLILGGLNEGTWPPQISEDPWLSRPMRASLGLPPLERRIGQTAHDFVQAASQAEVILTRAAKVDNTPTVPARWLQRLDALLGDDRRWQATLETAPIGWLQTLNMGEPQARAEPPAPRPPREARPRGLSVTEIETWLRDPYAIYAKHVLKLKPLDGLGEKPDARHRGNVIHDVLENFLKRHPKELPPPEKALAELLDLGRPEFKAWFKSPEIEALWWPRFERAMAWFVEFEAARRAAGIHPVLLEADGALQIDAPGGPFMLRARADRIDQGPDKRLAVLDYKTGKPPGAREVRAGLAPQLALEAAIARGSGFQDLASQEIAELLYIRLHGGEPAGEAIPIENPRDKDFPPADQLAIEALANLKAWIAAFDNPTMAYRARPRPQFIEYEGDYDHLARVAEWSAGGGRE